MHPAGLLDRPSRMRVSSTILMRHGTLSASLLVLFYQDAILSPWDKVVDHIYRHIHYCASDSYQNHRLVDPCPDWRIDPRLTP